jgi:hypothetical protein
MIRDLLNEIKADDYCKFKFNKKVDAALKALDDLEKKQAPDLAEPITMLKAALARLEGAAPGGDVKSRPRPLKSPAGPQGAAVAPGTAH